MTERLAAGSTEEAAAFNKQQVVSGSREWFRMCLKLQRMARQLPAVYPTALSASMAVPKSERIVNVEDWRRGMVGFSYDPRIEGTAGHIFFVVGRTKAGTLLTFSNDVKEPGSVDVVPVDYFSRSWGQTLQFASSHLNGYNFAEPDKKPESVWSGNYGEQYEQAIELLKKVHAGKLKKFGANNKLVINLAKDIERMEKRLS